MNRKQFSRMAAVAGCVFLGSGCRSGDIFYRPQRPVVRADTQPYVIGCEQVDLASAVGPERNLPTASAPAQTGAATAPAGASTRPAYPPTQPAARLAYTSPALHVQGMNFLTLSAASAVMGATLAGGKEAAESGVATSHANALGGVAGISSLGAPQARTLNAVVGQPGLQQGFAVGLGLVPAYNLFTPQIIPLSGPTGRCQDLVNAGFFPSLSACQCHFGHCTRR